MTNANLLLFFFLKNYATVFMFAVWDIWGLMLSKWTSERTDRWTKTLYPFMVFLDNKKHIESHQTSCINNKQYGYSRN